MKLKYTAHLTILPTLVNSITPERNEQMASSPIYKVYRDGEYVASCKHTEDAAAICGMGGEKVMVKLNHRKVIYDHSKDNEIASDSWDEAAEIMRARSKS